MESNNDGNIPYRFICIKKYLYKGRLQLRDKRILYMEWLRSYKSLTVFGKNFQKCNFRPRELPSIIKFPAQVPPQDNWLVGIVGQLIFCASACQMIKTSSFSISVSLENYIQTYNLQQNCDYKYVKIIIKTTRSA